MPSIPAVASALRAVKAAEPDVWAPLIVAACERHGINTAPRVAAFLGNVLHETSGLDTLVENLNYTPARLMELFGRTGRITTAQASRLGRTGTQKADQQAIANIIYGGSFGLRQLGNTQPNDGWYFRGRGCIQLTGRANHTAFAKALGINVVELQALLDTNEGAMDSAAAFWTKKGCNALADQGRLLEVRKIINGGTLGLAEVLEGTATVLAALQKA